MSIEDQDESICEGCRQVVTLLNRAHTTMDQAPEPDPFAVIEGMPFMLEGALTHLLAGFDYEAQKDSRLGMAVQLLSMAAARAEGLRVRAGELRQPVES